MSDEGRLAEIRDTYVDGLVISSGSAVAVVQELLAHIDALAADLATATARAAALEGIVESARLLVSEGMCHPSERYIRMAELVYAMDDTARALLAERQGAGEGSEGAMGESCHYCREPITRHESWTTVMDGDGLSRTYHDDCHRLDSDEHRDRGERLPEDRPMPDATG